MGIAEQGMMGHFACGRCASDTSQDCWLCSVRRDSGKQTGTKEGFEKLGYHLYLVAGDGHVCCSSFAFTKDILKNDWNFPP